MAKFNNFQLMAMMKGLICHFIDIPCMFKFSVAKERQLELKLFFLFFFVLVICLSGIRSFSDNAMYKLHNQSSANLQFSLTFRTFSRLVNSQLLVLLQR